MELSHFRVGQWLCSVLCWIWREPSGLQPQREPDGHRLHIGGLELNRGLTQVLRGRNMINPTLVLPFPSSLMFWHSLIAFWDYLFDFLPLLSHSPPWVWWSRFSMIVWSITSPQIKHRQLKKGPFEPKNCSWIIIPLHRLHFTLTSKKLSLWDHGDWNKVNAAFYWKRC